MAVLLEGRTQWSLDTDEEGYKTYTLVNQVMSDITEGPLAIINCPGLPVPGVSTWMYGNDDDPSAWCRPNYNVKPNQLRNEPTQQWQVTHYFSNAPLRTQRCADAPPDEPLLEPDKVFISVIRFQEEATYDRHGFATVNSSFEQIRGAINEWDKGRLVVRIIQNVPELELATLQSLLDSLNDSPMWGFLTRCVKLSDFTAEPRKYGQCYGYWVRTLIFETNKLTFDRDTLDEGTKVLNGHWHPVTGAWILDNINGEEPDPLNPSHFIRLLDKYQQPMRAILDGAGKPAIDFIVGDPYVSIQDSNMGQALTNTEYWRPLASTSVPAWDENADYADNAVVHYTESSPFVYIALEGNSGVNPFESPPDSPWRHLPNGLIKKGSYSNTTTYQRGHWVTFGGASAGAGKIHLEKYDEADFFILGIPPAID